ncbi:DUF5301 domain-containing protein [Streptococcus cameli]
MKKVLAILALVGLCMLAYWIWPGEAPNLPKASDVREIHLVKDQEEVVIDQPEAIGAFLAELGHANKTRQDSVHDAPLVSPHVRIDFVMTEGEAAAYVYERRLGTYLEFPYTGIYKLKEPPQLIQDMLAD